MTGFVSAVCWRTKSKALVVALGGDPRLAFGRVIELEPGETKVNSVEGRDWGTVGVDAGTVGMLDASLSSTGFSRLRMPAAEIELCRRRLAAFMLGVLRGAAPLELLAF